MGVKCTSLLRADKLTVKLPDTVTLALDVAASNSVNSVRVEFVIIDPKIGVRFAGGGTVHPVTVAPPAALFEVSADVRLECRPGTQPPDCPIRAEVYADADSKPSCRRTTTVGIASYGCAPVAEAAGQTKAKAAGKANAKAAGNAKAGAQ